MLTVTDRAAHYLLEALSSRDEELAGQTLRIVFRNGSYELTLDDARETDEVYQFEGESYLLVAPDVAEALSKAAIDMHEVGEGVPPRLTLSTG